MSNTNNTEQKEKQLLRKMEYSVAAAQALISIENFVVILNKHDYAYDLISEFLFMENPADDNRKQHQQQSTKMSLIQEFQLVTILCEFFNRPRPEERLNAIFFTFFAMPTPTRTRILLKLVSTGISGSVVQILSGAGAWMQQLECTSKASVELAQHLIKDFVTYSKKIPDQLKQLPLLAPRFAANFMTAVTHLYMNEVKKDTIIVPTEILEMFTEWVTDYPNLCTAAHKLTLLPGGNLQVEVTTPLAGLIKWCVLAPGLNQTEFYDKLHLAVLETLTQIPAGTTPRAIFTGNFIKIINALLVYARNLKIEKIEPVTDENYNKCMQRFAQSIQIAVSNNHFSGNVPQLLEALEPLPSNNLMKIVLKANKIS